jgi:hypothetical protein
MRAQGFLNSASGNAILAVNYGVQPQKFDVLNEALFGSTKHFYDGFQGFGLSANGSSGKRKDGNVGRNDIAILYNQFWLKVVLTDTSTHYLRSFNLGFISSKDLLYKIPLIDLLYSVGVNYGRVKLNRLGENNTYRNPYFGICAGLESRINIYGKNDKGMSIGVRARYQLDLSRSRWIDKNRDRIDLPAMRFSGWAGEVFVGRCIKSW